MFCMKDRLYKYIDDGVPRGIMPDNAVVMSVVQFSRVFEQLVRAALHKPQLLSSCSSIPSFLFALASLVHREGSSK